MLPCIRRDWQVRMRTGSRRTSSVRKVGCGLNHAKSLDTSREREGHAATTQAINIGRFLWHFDSVFSFFGRAKSTWDD